MPADRRGRRGLNRRWTDGVWFLPPLRFQFKWPSVRPSVRPSPVHPTIPAPSTPSTPIPVRATAFGYNLVFQAAAPQNAFHSACNFVSFFSFSIYSVFFFFWFFWLFGFPFSCRACCSAIKCTNCNWPNANRKLYMEINYDTNATNERDKIEFPLSVCVLSCCAV